MDLDIIKPVACEAVDLVDDAIGDLVRGDVVEHPLQIGPVGRTGRFPGVNELRHDPRTQRVGLPAVGFALRGDGEAFVAPAFGGLFLG